jgi:hypothetical protein
MVNGNVGTTPEDDSMNDSENYDDDDDVVDGRCCFGCRS